MSRRDRLETMPGQARSQRAIREYCAHTFAHLAPVPHAQVINIGSEEPFAVFPKRRYQRNTACQRFEHSDRGHTHETVCVSASRHVHSHEVACERCGHAVVGTRPAIVDAGICERGQCLWRVTHTEDLCRQPELTGRFDQKLVQLAGALLIAPVADPYEVTLMRVDAQRTEATRIRRFVPHPNALRPTAIEIAIRNRSTERQHSGVVLKMQGFHGLGRSDAAITRGIEADPTARATCPLTYFADQLFILPYVNEYHIRVLQDLVEVARLELIAMGFELGIRAR